MAQSGVPLKFMGSTLGNFQPVPGIMEALAAAQDFADGKLACLLLIGPTGVGKTHLAVGASRQRAMTLASPWFAFLNMPQFLDRIRATFGQHGQEEESDLMAVAQAAPIVVIDDLGAQRDTPWANERIYCIVDARYSQGLATVVTTNVLPGEWEPRVRSRLMDRQGARAVTITAVDYRTGGKA
jgi:DNA replication protein DnaC